MPLQLRLGRLENCGITTSQSLLSLLKPLSNNKKGMLDFQVGVQPLIVVQPPPPFPHWVQYGHQVQCEFDLRPLT